LVSPEPPLGAGVVVVDEAEVVEVDEVAVFFFDEPPDSATEMPTTTATTTTTAATRFSSRLRFWDFCSASSRA